MQHSAASIKDIIWYETNLDLDYTNYWTRFKETKEGENSSSLADKAMFWFFYQMKKLTIEGNIDSLSGIKTKDNDLVKWKKAMRALELIKEARLNIFVTSQTQYQLHLACEVVNYIGQVDSKYMDYMFCDNLKKVPITYWSYNPDYPFIMNKTIDILTITSKEKDLIEKDYKKVSSTLEKYGITEERIKTFDTDWQKDKSDFYGNIYGSVLATDSSDSKIQPFKENVESLKVFLKKNYGELYSKIQKITNGEFIAIMDKIYDNNFDYSILTPDDIKYIHKKQQEIFTATQDTTSVVGTADIADIYTKLIKLADITKAELIDAGKTAGAGAAMGATLMLGVTVLPFICHVFGVLSAGVLAGAAPAIPIIGSILGGLMIIASVTLYVTYYFKSEKARNAITFGEHLTQISESEKARNKAFEDKDLDSLMIKEVALFSAFNKDTEAHDVDLPTPIQSGSFLDEILYHGKPVVREDIYKQIKLILS